MRHHRRTGIVLISLVLVVTGCGSADPSRTASPAATGSADVPASSAPPIQPSPTITPTPATSESPTPTPEALVPGSVLKTVADRIRVRSEPRVSDDSAKYEPLLPLGTFLEVVDGPIEASGYFWYQVVPIGVSLEAATDRGWVAIADHDGTPWVALDEPPLAGIELAISEVDREVTRLSDAKRAASDITAFGLDLYRRLLADPSLDLKDENVVFSPTSIALALGLARAGAKGKTASEIDDVLHATDWDELGPGLNALDQAIASRDGTYTDDEGGVHQLALRVANTAFAQRDWSIEPAYLDRIGETFGAGLHLVDYEADPEAARRTINGWVSRQTERRIPELLQPPDVSTATRLYLVNAVYLKANWLVEFDKERTQPRTFRRLDGSSVDVPTMQLSGEQEVPLIGGDGWSATELRYRGRDGTVPLAMTLILPDDLASFERGLTAAQLAGISSRLKKERQRLSEDIGHDDSDLRCPTYPYSLRLFMPRFGAETRAKLGGALAKLGMQRAFDPTRADFSVIHQPDELYISAVIHQANIDVDEEGTEAAAATAVGMDTTGGCGPAQPRKQVTMRLDRPFLFILRDLETGAVLFMGRVVDPSIAR